MVYNWLNEKKNKEKPFLIPCIILSFFNKIHYNFWIYCSFLSYWNIACDFLFWISRSLKIDSNVSEKRCLGKEINGKNGPGNEIMKVKKKSKLYSFISKDINILGNFVVKNPFPHLSNIQFLTVSSFNFYFEYYQKPLEFVPFFPVLLSNW